MTNVLLTCCANGSVDGVIDHLHKLGVAVHISDSADSSPYENKVYYHTVPQISSPTYKSVMRKLCDTFDIDIIIPSISEDALFFSKHRKSFDAVSTVSSKFATEMTCNKAMCYYFLNYYKFPVPQFCTVTDKKELDFAVHDLGMTCFKPQKHPNGSGKGFRIIDDVQAHKNMFTALTSEMYYVSYSSVVTAFEWRVEEEDPPELLMMEYLPGTEYSVYCFCHNGRAKYIVPIKRIETVNMCSSVARIDMNRDCINLARQICELYEFEYNINIQLKRDKLGNLKVVEINPRIAGSVMLPVTAGVDMLSMTLLKAAGRKYFYNYSASNIIMKRHWGEVYDYV